MRSMPSAGRGRSQAHEKGNIGKGVQSWEKPGRKSFFLSVNANSKIVPGRPRCDGQVE